MAAVKNILYDSVDTSSLSFRHWLLTNGAGRLAQRFSDKLAGFLGLGENTCETAPNFPGEVIIAQGKFRFANDAREVVVEAVDGRGELIVMPGDRFRSLAKIVYGQSQRIQTGRQSQKSLPFSAVAFVNAVEHNARHADHGVRQFDDLDHYVDITFQYGPKCRY